MCAAGDDSIATSQLADQTLGTLGNKVRMLYLEDTTSLLVDQARDTLDTSTASQTADSRLGDTLDVVTKDLPVTLGTSFSKTFASLASARHVAELL